MLAPLGLFCFIMDNIKKLRIQEIDVYLEDIRENAGKVTISGTDRNYSAQWGAMNGNLTEFLLKINSDYFASNLLGSRSSYAFNTKATFAEIRRYIREELDLPWYKHLAFQSTLRDSLNTFQESMKDYPDERYFVDNFNYYLTVRPDFHLIDDRYEQKRIKSDFESLTEPWYFTQKSESEECKWLKSFHTKIKKALK